MILIGQDALGGWAWMLFSDGKERRLIECGQDYHNPEAAMDAANDAWAGAKIRGEPGCPTRPRFVFPDGLPPIA